MIIIVETLKESPTILLGQQLKYILTIKYNIKKLQHQSSVQMVTNIRSIWLGYKVYILARKT